MYICVGNLYFCVVYVAGSVCSDEAHVILYVCVSVLSRSCQFWADLHKLWHVASWYPTDGHGVGGNKRHSCSHWARPNWQP